MSRSYLSVPNLGCFIHAKDFHKGRLRVRPEIVNCSIFTRMPDSAKGQFFMLLNLAVCCHNRILDDDDWLRVRLGLDPDITIDRCKEIGMLVPHDPECDLLEQPKPEAPDSGPPANASHWNETLQKMEAKKAKRTKKGKS
ncbi:hypothetical protein D5125_02875 [Magnetovirga frankeli]|uniref:hypothetical protein n=1 Tax=Magnetovirga frankeli TaxID=947516 RepID=UPI001293A5F9|nr:hypothetical protein D5125_02875 [gamma proteobacterium SS-5]